jgi:hypothetical protein
VLGVVRQAEPLRGQEIEHLPLALRGRVDTLAQPSEVVVPVPGTVGRHHLAGGQREEKVADQVTIQVAMNELVRLAEQAIVAGCAAPLGPALAVVTGRRIDVTDIERLAGDRGEAGRVFDQPLEHADAALGRLPEQDSLVLPCPTSSTAISCSSTWKVI